MCDMWSVFMVRRASSDPVVFRNDHGEQDDDHGGVVVQRGGQLQPERVGQHLAQKIKHVRRERHLSGREEPVADAVGRDDEHPLNGRPKLGGHDLLNCAGVFHARRGLHEQR